MAKDSIEKQKVDRSLIGLVTGISLLVIVGLVLVGRVPAEISYQPENAPEGIALNYLLALQREEYERAYTYLAPDLPGYPADTGTFFIEVQRWCFEGENSNSRLAIEDVEIVEDRAIVTIAETVYSGQPTLFSDNRYLRLFDVTLERAAGRWLITHSERCWSYSWRQEP